MKNIYEGFVTTSEIAIYIKRDKRTAQRKLKKATESLGKDKITFVELCSFYNWSEVVV
jgi:hypothetical protein